MKKSSIITLIFIFVMIFTSAFAAASFADDTKMTTIALNAGSFGYFGNPSVSYTYIDVPEGSKFYDADLTEPTPASDEFLFAGWYTRLQGRGEEITEETTVDGAEFLAYANWAPNQETIRKMEADTVYPIQLGASREYYSFTPDETAMYDIATSDNDADISWAAIRLLDGKLIEISRSDTLDLDHNAVITEELTAGTTYYIELGYTLGYEAAYNVSIVKTTTVPITFHANIINEGEAYFDGDTSLTEKTMDIRMGRHLESFRGSGLEIAEDAYMNLLGWSLDPDSYDKDEELLATEPMDVYAVYSRLNSTVLDANGGYFLSPDKTQDLYVYIPGEPFSPSTDPQIDDPGLEFAGWATTPDAEEPDIFESIPYDDLGEVLYAIYADPVKVTYDGNGGIFFDNPDLKIYEKTYGKGHIFYAAHVENNPLTLIGWRDQDGEIIRTVEESNPYYIFDKDTYLTAIWAREVCVDANGGYFWFNRDTTALYVKYPIDAAFSNDYIIGMTGEPINDDDMKYLAGWATTPDASDPDLTDGVSDISEIARIYAVWKDDSYYIVEGDDQTWEKGSEDGLTVTVKRTGDDTVTFSCFRSVDVDGEQIFSDSFSTKEGSLIFTLNPDYLESLAVGDHELSLNFTEDESVIASFTVAEPDPEVEPDTKPDSDEKSDTKPDSGEKSDIKPDSGEKSDTKPDSSEKSAIKPDNKSNSNVKPNTSRITSPKTGDSALIWVLIFGISAIVLAGNFIYKLSRK